ncbi:general secretion pathway protein GspN [Bradyrhizobium commune]|uniref:General secretion pathway protein GspN n=1 Tax=Bradyrhizobium commune TaxID=83627 RepID=A0A7S9D362_9BRAD|nr:general secretion pathway protein GspN [Bradyrhizobium commune]QPF90327.1 general secretion pathway protein GspN [Bradyrhizobium commune]
MGGRGIALLTLAFVGIAGGLFGARARGAFDAGLEKTDPELPALKRLPPEDASPAETRPQGNPLWGVPIGSLAETIQRPIFTALRRPPSLTPAPIPGPAAAPEPVRQSAPQRPNLKLVGTISGGALRLGVFLDETSQQPTRLAVGENHNGWVLRAVSPSDARFESEDRAVTLLLRVEPDAHAPPKDGAAPREEPAALVPARHRRR